MLKFIELLIVIVCFSACAQTITLPKSNVNPSFESYFESKGLVIVNSEDENLQKDFIIYNLNGTEYCRLNLLKDLIYYNNTTEELSTLQGLLLDPYEFYPDYYILKFEIESIINDSIYVFIDKAKLVKKKIFYNRSQVSAETWREYFIGAMVDFNEFDNPIKGSPDLNTKNRIISSDINVDDYFFTIGEIKGNWIFIECTDLCGIECPNGLELSGWIMWKKEGKMIIKLVSAC
jgi:hypothetical protein